MECDNIKYKEWIVSLFLLISGCSALIYQVLWVRLLSLSIGSTSISISTVLAAFFLGLGLGSYFAGNILKKFKHPFKIYLFVEIGIAISAVILLPLLLNLDSYIAMFPILESSLGIKFFLVMILLLVPTFLIGTTFPLLMSVVITHRDEIGPKLAHFYALNTLGAVCGVLLSGLVFIPHYGLDGTLYIAALLNISVALIGVIFYKQFSLSNYKSIEKSKITYKSNKTNNKALVVLFITGLSAIATEVGWMKFLIIYTGNTIYGFSLILAMFLVGLAIGSWIARSRFIYKLDEQKTLFFGLLLLGIMLLFARAGLGVFPEIYNYLQSWQVDAFVYRWSKYLAMLLLLLPATIMFGVLFPIALRVYSPEIDRFYGDVGRGYAVNTFAGIIGSLIAGFLFIPYFSTDILLTTMALIVVLASLLFIKGLKSRNTPFIWTVFAILFLVASYNLAHIDYRKMIDIVLKRETFTHSNDYTTHYIKEGQTGVISVISYDNNPCIKKLLNNGLSESWIDTCNENNLLLSEFLLGEIPSLLHHSAKKAFVVGLGGGTSVKALAMNDLVSIDVVELEPAVVDAMRSIYSGNLPIEEDKRVSVTINDARNSLLMSDDMYDIIVSQPSHPWLAGASNIMNKDFFEIVKSKLSEGGIYAQWVPLFKIDVETLKSIIKAYTDTFGYVISFVNVSSHDLLLFGSNKPIIYDYEKIEKQMQDSHISKVLELHNIKGSYDLIRYFALSRDQLVKIVSSSDAATDTNLLAETFYSRYDKVVGNSFDTLGFLRQHFRYDISAYIKDKTKKKLYEQYYYFKLNRYDKEAELLKKSIELNNL